MSTYQLASRMENMRPSWTLSISSRARAMKQEGKDVISLAAGEPDFNTPDPICQAAIEAIHEGMTKYTQTQGVIELRTAICEKLKKENGIHTAPDQIVVSCGAKHSLFNAMMALINPGDEVILIAPYWLTYHEQVILAGGTPVIVQTSADQLFVPTYDQIQEKITKRTKAILINTPNNPTGAVWSRQVLKDIATLAIRHGLWVVSDEIYEKLIYEGEHQSIAALGSDIAAQTITINGCSKTYSMTGWRIGYSASPPKIAQAMTTLQDQVTSSPTSFAQAGAIAAYQISNESLMSMNQEFMAKRDLMMNGLSQIHGISCVKPKGAFYVLVDVSSLLKGEIADDFQLAGRLLDEILVATIPGSVFGAPGYLRLSYATSRENIQKATKRLSYALKPL